MRQLLAYTWTAGIVVWATLASAASPLDPVQAVNQAIATRNVALFQRVVDTGALSRHVLDGVARQLASQPPQAQTEPLALFVAKLVEGDGAVRQVLAEEGMQFLIWGVASGAFAGQPREKLPEGGLLAAVLAQVSPGRKELRPVQIVEEEKGTAVVEADLVDHGTQSVYPLALRVVQGSDGWQIRHVLNVESLVARIRAEAMR
jgi:hypothetical protein